MAWEARSGLKHTKRDIKLLQSPRRNGLGSPFGIETRPAVAQEDPDHRCRNGLGSPFGIETARFVAFVPSSSLVGMAWEARSGLKHCSPRLASSS